MSSTKSELKVWYLWFTAYISRVLIIVSIISALTSPMPDGIWRWMIIITFTVVGIPLGWNVWPQRQGGKHAQAQE